MLRATTNLMISAVSEKPRLLQLQTVCYQNFVVVLEPTYDTGFSQRHCLAVFKVCHRENLSK